MDDQRFSEDNRGAVSIHQALIAGVLIVFALQGVIRESGHIFDRFYPPTSVQVRIPASNIQLPAQQFNSSLDEPVTRNDLEELKEWIAKREAKLLQRIGQTEVKSDVLTKPERKFPAIHICVRVLH